MTTFWMKALVGLVIVIAIGALAYTWYVSPITSIPTGTLSGKVMLGPTCPVQHEPPDPGCTDRPYTGELVVMTPDESRTIQTITPNAAGEFNVTLPAGEYVIVRAKGTNPFPICRTSGTVTVRAGEVTDVPVSCDTGIR